MLLPPGPNFGAESTSQTQASASSTPAESKLMNFLQRARILLAVCGGVYVLLIALLTIPFIQTHIVYLHAFKLPWFAKFELPEHYGLAPGKTFSFRLQSQDNTTLGAWFVLSDQYYKAISASPEFFSPPNQTELLERHIPVAVKTHPTIIFFHGNAATRAFHVRVAHYAAFSSRLGANVLAIDYRGFADSAGTPTEDGLALDARAAWNWLSDQGVNMGENVVIVGHSLGTAVAARLAAELNKEGLTYRGLVLLAPFQSIETLLDDYYLFGLVPLIKPLAIIPGAKKIVSWSLVHKFNTLAIIPDIKGPVVLAHAENDWEIPYTHSEDLFNIFLSPSLPPAPEVYGLSSWTKEQWSTFESQQQARSEAFTSLVSTRVIPGFGTLKEFKADGRKVIFVKSLQGGHDRPGVQEGVQDIIRKSIMPQ